MAFAYCNFYVYCFACLLTRYGFSIIFNPDEQTAWLRVAEGSHNMSHLEQYNNNVTQDTNRVKLVGIKKNEFILFYRNLLHQGVSYEEEHCRIFGYVEIYPKSFKGALNHANPNVTSKYVPPGESDIAPVAELKV